jgi:hypothetical protein
MNKKKLILLYRDKGITSCELKLDGCWGDYLVTLAHRHKRRWYYTRPEKLWTFKQTLLACPSCHNKIEYDQDLTKKLFTKLRR